MRYAKIFLLIVSGTMMLGQGLRMIYEGLGNYFGLHSHVYAPGYNGLLDILFDWTTLSIAGFLLFGWGLYLFFKKYDKDHHIEWEVNCPYCGYIYVDNIAKKHTVCPSCWQKGDIDLQGFDLDHAKRVTHPSYHSS